LFLGLVLRRRRLFELGELVSEVAGFAGVFLRRHGAAYAFQPFGHRIPLRRYQRLRALVRRKIGGDLDGRNLIRPQAGFAVGEERIMCDRIRRHSREQVDHGVGMARHRVSARPPASRLAILMPEGERFAVSRPVVSRGNDALRDIDRLASGDSITPRRPGIGG
jgi:hypothetical protein